MGLYSEEFVYTPEYSQLATRFPRDSPPLRYWRQISREHAYDPSRSKGSTLHSPTLRVVHRLLAQTINAMRDSPGVVGEQDLLYLLSMRERYPIHLGYAVANFIHTQAHRKKTAALYAGHYITRLVRGMGLFDHLPPMELMCRMTPIQLTTLVSMRMLERRHGPQGQYYVLAGAPHPPAKQLWRVHQDILEQSTPPQSHSAPIPPPFAKVPTEPSSSQSQLDRIENILG